MRTLSMKRKAMTQGNRLQRGVSLVEVMVAMLVTTAGLLGFAGLQTRALTATEDAYLRVQAMSIAQDLIERARIRDVVGPSQSFAPANSGYADPNNWSGTLGATPPSKTANCYANSMSMFIGNTCSSADMLAVEVYQLRRRAEKTLPNGTLWGGTCSSGRFCVYVAWGDMTAADCELEYLDASSPSVPRECLVIEGV